AGVASRTEVKWTAEATAAGPARCPGPVAAPASVQVCKAGADHGSAGNLHGATRTANGCSRKLAMVARLRPCPYSTPTPEEDRSMPDRRSFLQSAGLAAASMLAMPALARAAVPASAAAGDRTRARIAAAPDFAALEAASQGRLGVAVLEAGNGRYLAGHRADERFPMCSTFKALLAAAVLARADRGALDLDERLPVRAADLVPHAPVTRRHVGKDLGVRDLCRAIVTISDNTAANLLFARIGGPAALTACLRGRGGTVTRSDRLEPEMNGFVPGDPGDTTSPRAMATSLGRCVAGAVLAPASRLQLADWLIDNTTGDD